MEEEWGEHPQQGEESPMRLVVVKEVKAGEQIGHHVRHVKNRVDQEEEWPLPPPSSCSPRHQLS